MLRCLIVAMTLTVLGCATGGANNGPSPMMAGDPVDPIKADQGQNTDIEWANQFFLTQIYDARFNPQGVEIDVESNNCGPSSLAMLMRQREAIAPDMGPEQAIDHARATMYADYPDIDPAGLPEGATVHEYDGTVLVDDDTHPVYFDVVEGAASVAQGIRTGGASPVFGSSWSELDGLLATVDGVIAHGHITDVWRDQFSGDYGASSPGAVSHFIAIFLASTAGEFIVCDPMHRGGAVLMTRRGLAAFFRSPVNVYETSIRVVTWDESPVMEQSGNSPPPGL